VQLGKGFLSASANQSEDLLPICSEVLPDFLRCINIRRAIRWRRVDAQKGDDADKNRLNSVDRQPSLRCILVSPLVLTRGVKDGNADIAIGVNVGVPHGSDKPHRWWHERILERERQSCLEDASLIEGVARSDDDNLPFKQVVVLDESG